MKKWQNKLYALLVISAWGAALYSWGTGCDGNDAAPVTWISPQKLDQNTMIELVSNNSETTFPFKYELLPGHQIKTLVIQSSFDIIRVESGIQVQYHYPWTINDIYIDKTSGQHTNAMIKWAGFFQDGFTKLQFGDYLVHRLRLCAKKADNTDSLICSGLADYGIIYDPDAEFTLSFDKMEPITHDFDAVGDPIKARFVLTADNNSQNNIECKCLIDVHNNPGHQLVASKVLIPFMPAASVDIEMEIGGTLQPDTYDIWGSCGNGVTSQKRTLLVTGLPVNITHQNLPVVYDNQIGFDLPSGFDGGVANAFAVMRCSLVFQPGWCFNTPKLIELTDARFKNIYKIVELVTPKNIQTNTSFAACKVLQNQGFQKKESLILRRKYAGLADNKWYRNVNRRFK